MKTLIYFFAVAMLLFAGCAKDEMFDDNINTPELKKAKVPIPVKGEVCMIPNPEGERMPVTRGPNGTIIPGMTLDKTANFYGIQSHMGKLGEQSLMTGVSAYLDLAELPTRRVIVTVYEVMTFAANGDYTTGISESRIDVTDIDNKIITGTYTITGGSGRFENVSGGGEISGVLPCWNVEGTIKYEK